MNRSVYADAAGVFAFVCLLCQFQTGSILLSHDAVTTISLYTYEICRFVVRFQANHTVRNEMMKEIGLAFGVVVYFHFYSPVGKFILYK